MFFHYLPSHDIKVVNRPRTPFLVVLGLLVLNISLGCTNPQSKSEKESSSSEARNDLDWSHKMQALSKTLSQLLPLVASRSQFEDEKNKDLIEKETQNLSRLAHSLHSGSKPSSDPSFQTMTGLFEEDIERALESLKRGNREYARSVLRDTTSYCIQCHTQSNRGPNFPRLSLDINTDDLPTLQRAEFFAATRQFDRALETYRKVIENESLAQTTPYEWEQACRASMAILVRVKQEPKAALDLLNSTILGHRNLPHSMKKTALAWKNSLSEWKKEKRKNKAATADAILAQSEKLLNQAHQRQEFPLDHSQDILYFRASSLLHDLLDTEGKESPLAAKTLYLSGLAAEATRDLNFWTLHETYFELCIERAPHTKLAEQCFERLNDSIVLGYSGSGGVHIPPEVGQRLSTLKGKAKSAPPIEIK